MILMQEYLSCGCEYSVEHDGINVHSCFGRLCDVHFAQQGDHLSRAVTESLHSEDLTRGKSRSNFDEGWDDSQCSLPLGLEGVRGFAGLPYPPWACPRRESDEVR